MRKQGYIITKVGNSITIQSTFYFVDNSGTLNALQRQAFSAHVINNIQTIWSTTGNPGLNLELNTPASQRAYSINTIINTFWTLPNRKLTQGECLITVMQGWGRSYINMGGGEDLKFSLNCISSAIGKLFTRSNSRTGVFFYNNRNLPGTNPIPYLESPLERNTFAHEFGHLLGLADRYIGICNTRIETGTSHPFGRLKYNDGVTQVRSYEIVPHGGFNYAVNNGATPLNVAPPLNAAYAASAAFPMYLKGEYDPTNSSYGNFPSEYDPNYSRRYGWVYNLMSMPRGPFPYPFPAVDTALHTTIYGGLPNTFRLITPKQVDVILDYSYIEEKKHSKIFDRYIYAQRYTNNSIDNVTNSKFTNNLGSFVGHLVNGNNHKVYLTDEKFPTRDGLTGLLGLNRQDVMDYRMSDFNTQTLQYSIENNDFHGHFNLMKDNCLFSVSDLRIDFHAVARAISFGSRFNIDQNNNVNTSLLRVINKLQLRSIEMNLDNEKDIYENAGVMHTNIKQSFWNWSIRTAFINDLQILFADATPIPPTATFGTAGINRDPNYASNVGQLFNPVITVGQSTSNLAVGWYQNNNLLMYKNGPNSISSSIEQLHYFIWRMHMLDMTVNVQS